MIRHIVLIRFKSDVAEPQISALFAELRDIEGQVAGLLSISAGRSESPEKMERGYMHGFIVDFDSWDGLAAYQDHPAHRRLGAKLVDHADGGKDGILCFDFDTAGPVS